MARPTTPRWSSSSAGTWPWVLGEPVARPEAPERTVVAPDARGYGGSSDADGPFGSPMTSSGCWTPSRSIELRSEERRVGEECGAGRVAEGRNEKRWE